MDLKKDKQYTRGKRPMETKIYSVHSSVFSSEKKYFSLAFLIFFLEKSLPPKKYVNTIDTNFSLHPRRWQSYLASWKSISLDFTYNILGSAHQLESYLLFKIAYILELSRLTNFIFISPYNYFTTSVSEPCT